MSGDDGGKLVGCAEDRGRVYSKRFCNDALALLARLRRLLVERRSDLGRSAAVGEAGHDDNAADRAEPDLDRVAHRDLSCRLDPLAADLDVTCEDEVGRCAPRLRKTCRPQPLVDAYAIHVSES